MPSLHGESEIPTRGNPPRFTQASSRSKKRAAREPAQAARSGSAKVADQPPTSLSELPGAAATGAGDVERASALAGNPAALLDFMADMAPAKRDRLMNSVV